eukprot:TRINITY_DN36393_c0_g1_i1.p3 TRINITY_DN36393_c0_g1~~TRINITY_DN36393_c0_g1_i1.p3  ORF type:complete len:251 (-),score=20.71 TRINITY_DN36393_c0_g1_i1:547-1260(-)
MPPLANLPAFKGLLVDVSGTLLQQAESTGAVYQRYGWKYGVRLTTSDIECRYQRYYTYKEGSNFREDALDFWQSVVYRSTGCKDPRYFKELFDYFQTSEAYRVTPGAIETMRQLKQWKVKSAIVTNNDSRVRNLLDSLALLKLFDEVIVSDEVGCKKPNPLIFEIACNALGLHPYEVLHVGDDWLKDICGARKAGIRALHWGTDIHSFEAIKELMAKGDTADENIWIQNGLSVNQYY